MNLSACNFSDRSGWFADGTTTLNTPNMLASDVAGRLPTSPPAWDRGNGNAASNLTAAGATTCVENAIWGTSAA